MVKKIMTCLLFAVFGLQGGAQTVDQMLQSENTF